MMSLQMRMMVVLALMFGLVYAIVVMIGSAMGVTSFSAYFIMALVVMVIQYMIGPKLVEWSMRVKYVTENESPKLYAMVREQAERAGIPMPRVAISQIAMPNAFAFGRWLSDGRVCVTSGIMSLLNEEELKAVIGHEMSHLKNRDVLTITLLSVIPIVMYEIARRFLFWHGYGHRRDSRDNAAAGVAIGMAALVFYFVANLLVLYASRIREYFADMGSVSLGNRPSALASALYKLVYGSARMNKEDMKDVEGMKAFFVNDPSRAYNELKTLAEVDRDRSGTIDDTELAAIRTKTVNVTFSDKLLELLGTHPNMLKRIQHLSSLDAPVGGA